MMNRYFVAGLLALAAPIASAADGTPQEIANAFYTRHFAGNMALTEAGVTQKSKWLMPELQQQLLAKLREKRPKDEAPDINGDPFTDSQEYPKSFRIGKLTLHGGEAKVGVAFSGHGKKHQLTLIMKNADGWRIDDIDYGNKLTLRKLAALRKEAGK